MRARQLFENHAATILEDAARTLFASLKNDGETMVHSYVRMEAGLAPFKSDDGKPNPENMDELVYQWCVNRVEEVYGELEYLGRNGSIPAWRVVTAPKTWKPSDWEHPGIYWSWDQSAAEAHWGNAHDTTSDKYTTWEMAADIPVTNIDWVATLVMNGNPSYEHEKEIRLKVGVPINVKSCIDLET